MATSVILPKQGQSVETCIITEWYKKKGDRVEKGEILFAYETDKSSFEEEARATGTLLEVFFEEGDEVPVLTEVAVIGEPGEKIGGRPDVPFVASTLPESPEGQAAGSREEKIPVEGQGEDPSEAGGKIFPKEDGGTAEEGEGKDSPEEEGKVTGEGGGKILTEEAKPDGRLRISPRARKMAEMKGIRAEGISGSGPNGRIIVRDIEAALAGVAVESGTEAVSGTIPVTDAGDAVTGEPGISREAVPGAVPKQAPEIVRESVQPGGKVRGIAEDGGDWQDRPLTNMRRLIARAMHASLQNSAQLTHHLGADARSILSLRSKVKKMQQEGYAHNITLNDMVCFALVRALGKHPEVNVHFLGESIRYFRKIHLGIAVDTERGLMVPVLRDADDLSLPGLSNQVSRLAAACRSGKVDPDLLQPEAATFTVSNLGNYGVEMFTPVINLPQAAILGVNTILERPARMGDGTLGFIPYLGLSLTYDHRALDGGPATLFLAEIKKEIEQFDPKHIEL